MKFEAFWKILKNDLVKTKPFRTYRKKKPFNAKTSNRDSIQIKPLKAKNGPYYLTKEKMSFVWKRAKKHSTWEKRLVVSQYRTKINNTSSYAVTFLNEYVRPKNLE